MENLNAGKIFRLDLSHRHFLSCPKLKGFGALIEKHLHTVESAAAGYFCIAKKPGFLRIIDAI